MSEIVYTERTFLPLESTLSVLIPDELAPPKTGADSRSIKNQIYENILSDILSGVYPSGSLLTEPALIAKYHVSKTSTREALVQLCSEGILKNIPRCGYQLIQISVAEIHNLLDLRIILELGALEKTAALLTTESINRLYQCIKSDTDSVTKMSVLTSWNRNSAFHMLLCEFCCNQYLYNDLSHVLKMCSLGANQSLLKTWGEKISPLDSLHSRHQLIIQALEHHQVEQAKKILKADILAMKNDLLLYPFP